MNVLKSGIKKARKKARHLLFGNLTFEHKDIELNIDKNRFFLGKILSRNFKGLRIKSLSEVEFQVYSQFKEDGIIQYLVQNVPIKNDTFVEIGCGNFAESNTRYLMENNNWRGVIIDKEKDHFAFLNSDSGKNLLYEFDVRPVQEMIEPDNVNKILHGVNIKGDIGLLSLDIDSVDYYVLEKISVIEPRIIVLEYNSVFGYKRSVSVPYKRNFDRMAESFTGLYFGASLKAFYNLLTNRGYVFVGCNTTGNNAFFVLKKYSRNVIKSSLKRGYVASRFRESKDKSGRLTYISGHKDRLMLIQNLILVDIETGKKIKCKELIG